MMKKLTVKEFAIILTALESHKRSVGYSVINYDPETNNEWIDKDSDNYPDYEAVCKLIEKIENMEV